MILVYILLAIVAILALRYSHDVIKRRGLMKSLLALESEVGGKMTVHKSPYKSIFKLSAKTEITFETDKSAYHIRLMSSFGFYKRIVHFASPDYVVSFRRFKFILLHAHSNIAMSHSFVLQDGFNYGCKVRILPKHEHVAVVDGKKNIDVFLFNPTPHTVSYVTPEKTSIRMARVDAEIYGNRVFTASTFCEHIRGEQVANGGAQAEPSLKTNGTEEAIAAKRGLAESRTLAAQGSGEKPLAERKIEAKPLDAYSFTPPSDDDFAYANPAPPPEEYEQFRPEEKSREILGKVKRALVILASLEALFLAFFFVSFFAFDRNGTLLFIAVALLVGNGVAGSVINSKIHLFMKRGATYRATVVSKAVHTPIRRGRTLSYQAYVYHVYPEGYLKPNETNRFGGGFSLTLQTADGKRHRVYLATKNHFGLYEEGDEVVKYAALPYPVIVSRKVNLSVCPACGNIRPAGGDICSECACILENTSESY